MNTRDKDLDETYQGPERRRFRPMHHIDRWGPMVISLLGILCLIGYAWANDQRVARLEGAYRAVIDSEQSRNSVEAALRLEVQTLQAHVVALRTAMAKYGIEEEK